MKKLLSLLSVLTIGGTIVPVVIAASSYQKEEKLDSEIIYLQTNNLGNLNRNKSDNINHKIIEHIKNIGNIIKDSSLHFQSAAPLLDGWIGGGMIESKNKLENISNKLIKLSTETEINTNELKENIIKISEIIKGHGYGLEKKWTSIWGSNIVVDLGIFVNKLGDIIYDIQNEINLVNKNNSDLKNELDNFKKNIEKLINENKKLEKDKINLQQNLDAKQSEINILVTNETNLKQEVTTKKIENIQLKTELGQLKTKNNKLIQENENKLTNLNSQITKLENKLNDANKEISDFEDKKNKLQQLKEDLIKKQNHELKQLNSQITDLNKNKTELEDKLEKINLEQNKLHKDLINYDVEIKKFKEKEYDFKKIKNNNIKLEKEISTIEEKIKLETEQDIIILWKEMLDTKTNKKEKNDESIKEKEANFKKTNLEIKDIEKSFKNTQSVIEKNKTIITELKNEIYKLIKKIRDLEIAREQVIKITGEIKNLTSEEIYKKIKEAYEKGVYILNTEIIDNLFTICPK